MVGMDIHSPGGFFPKRIKIFDAAASSLISFPFKARLSERRSGTVVEYEQLGSRIQPQKQELLEYPEDPTRPAYAKAS